MLEWSRRANETESVQKVFSKRRVEEQVKTIETRKFFEEKSGRASETEREHKGFGRVE